MDITHRYFQLLCEEISGEDLEWFFYQWLFTNRYLSYRIASQEELKQGETYSLRALIERMGDAKMPIPVKATFQDGKEVILWTKRALRISEITFTGSSPVKGVELDPDRRFPIVYACIECNRSKGSTAGKRVRSRMEPVTLGGKAVKTLGLPEGFLGASRRKRHR